MNLWQSRWLYNVKNENGLYYLKKVHVWFQIRWDEDQKQFLEGPSEAVYLFVDDYGWSCVTGGVKHIFIKDG